MAQGGGGGGGLALRGSNRGLLVGSVLLFYCVPLKGMGRT